MVDNSGLLEKTVTQESIDLVPFIKFEEFSSAQNLFIYNERKRLLQSLINSPTGQENSLIVQFDNLTPYKVVEGTNGKTKIADISNLYYAIHNHPDCGVLSPADLKIFCDEPSMKVLEALANNGHNTSIIIKMADSDVDGYREYVVKETNKYKNSLDEKYIDSHVDELFKFAEELLNA